MKSFFLIHEFYWIQKMLSEFQFSNVDHKQWHFFIVAETLNSDKSDYDQCYLDFGIKIGHSPLYPQFSAVQNPKLYQRKNIILCTP